MERRRLQSESGQWHRQSREAFHDIGGTGSCVSVYGTEVAKRCTNQEKHVQKCVTSGDRHIWDGIPHVMTNLSSDAGLLEWCLRPAASPVLVPWHLDIISEKKKKQIDWWLIFLNSSRIRISKKKLKKKQLFLTHFLHTLVCRPRHTGSLYILTFNKELNCLENTRIWLLIWEAS